MKNHFIYILLVMLVITGNWAYSQKTGTASKPSDVTIEGKVLDSLIQKRPSGETEVTILISRYPFSASNLMGTDYRRYELKVKYNELFKIHIPAPAMRFYMSIYYLPAPKRDINWSSFDNIYILEQGDSIHATLTKDFYIFSGEGCEKLNCESEIYRAKYNPSDSEWFILNKKSNYPEFITVTNRKMDSCLNLQKEIVKKYEPRLGKELSNIMLANCYGLRYYETLRGYRQMSGNLPGLYEAVIKSTDYANINFKLSNKIAPDILAQAPVYVDFLFEKIRMDNFLEQDGIVQLPISMGKSFNSVKQNYKGIIRDKLLALFFLNYVSIPTSFDYLEEALNLTGSTIYKDILLQVKGTKDKGLPFYPFELPDTQGKSVKLSDFNGKLVIVDFWYTGCINCINLKNAMQGIHDKYKDNPSVVFVSVSIDKDRQKWIKSVLSGLYADPTDINLFTGGMADAHPLIKKYAIQGYPTTFIIEDGKMFNANPPYPNGKSLNEGGTKQFIALIEDGLANH